MIEYEKEEKGLFTFYKEQAQQQEEITKYINNKNNQLFNKSKNSSIISCSHKQSLSNKNMSIVQRGTPVKVYQFVANQDLKGKKDSKTLAVIRKQRKQKATTTNFKVIIPKSFELKSNYQSNIELNQPGFYLRNKEFSVQEVNGHLQREHSEKIMEIVNTKNKKDIYMNTLSKVLKYTGKKCRLNEKQDHSRNLPMIDNVIQRKQYPLPKRYKSRRVELAIKSGDNEMIRRIRQSIKQQNWNEISYINLSDQSVIKQNTRDLFFQQKTLSLNSMIKKFKKNM